MNILRMIVREVSRLKPGGAVIVRRTEFLDVPASPPWTSIDRVMENVVGSSYEIIAHQRPITGDVEFIRLKEPLEDGRQTYVSPDRRDYYDFDGRYWSRNDVPLR